MTSKTQRIEIFGINNDQIYVGGKLGDEWNTSAGDIGFILLSTGDLFSVYLTGDGVWRIDQEYDTNKCQVSISRAPDEEEVEDYSDRAIVEGPFEWLDHWSNTDVYRGELPDRVEDMLEDCDHDQLMRVYRLVREMK